jgi:hypothetical protein
VTYATEVPNESRQNLDKTIKKWNSSDSSMYPSQASFTFVQFCFEVSVGNTFSNGCVLVILTKMDPITT